MITEIAALISAIAATAAAVGGAMWWLYRRGIEKGESVERLRQIERELELSRKRRPPDR